MGLFGTILEKLGLSKSTAQAAPQPAPSAPAPMASQPAAPPPPRAMAAVDVVAKLEGLAAANKEKLNWKTSIVDLLKLLGLDSSLTARKELATELKCPTDDAVSHQVVLLEIDSRSP